MPLDPTNPSVPTTAPINPEFLLSHQKLSAAIDRHVNLLTEGTSGTPLTEGGLYFRMLEAVLMGGRVASSDDAQIWATDLVRDYLTKYTLAGDRRPPTTPP